MGQATIIPRGHPSSNPILYLAALALETTLLYSDHPPTPVFFRCIHEDFMCTYKFYCGYLTEPLNSPTGECKLYNAPMAPPTPHLNGSSNLPPPLCKYH